ncbi:putative thiazole biosynthetic enzyme [Thermogladius calderae 1633]|uniref:Thiamine thiazole synthase n=1 Tax=Thermogladius calderae (strain DSM 22663 / VKM B-2946 / 1633) TaxID=1184251 RepID=I3TFA8_THEC1|nr:putative thiazole biosynthetic enzyme [Thermogladius calderae 1633]
MELESIITRLVVEESARELVELSESDVLVVGAGPSGLTAAKYLADKHLKVVVLEKRLSYGGGIGGGGSLFHKVVVDERALPVLGDFKVRYKAAGVAGYYVVDSAELMSKLAAGALDSGAKIILGAEVEDLVVRDNPLRVVGVMFKWSAITAAGLHVDPLFALSRAVVDATGHEAVLVSILSRKNRVAGVAVPGERSGFAERAERDVVEYTGRMVPGLYVAGMSVAAVHGLHRMGPIFTGMLLSGRKVAEAIARDLGVPQ